MGIGAIDEELGCALFDAAWGRPEALLVPAKFEPAGLRSQAAAGTLNPILTRLAGARQRDAAARGSLVKRLAGVPEREREMVVLELVRSHVAAALGHASAAAIEPEAAFADLGFDSLAAVELRNRLNAATGLRLQPTLVFDHPTSAAVARQLLADVDRLEPGGEGGARAEAELAEALSKLEAIVPALAGDAVMSDLADARLRALLDRLDAGGIEGEGEEDGEGLAALSNEEMFELIDEELSAP